MLITNDGHGELIISDVQCPEWAGLGPTADPLQWTLPPRTSIRVPLIFTRRRSPSFPLPFLSYPPWLPLLYLHVWGIYGLFPDNP